MVNKVILLGNVGKEPEIRTTDFGKVATFSLATSENWKNKQGEKQSKTEWHNIVIFGKLAEIVEMWVQKGQQLYLEGKMRTRNYETKEGDKRYITEVVLKDFDGVLQMIGKRDEQRQDNADNQTQTYPAANNTVNQPEAEKAQEGDPLPF